MSELTPPQRGQLQEALMSAFPDPDELEMLLWSRLDKYLAQLAPKAAAYKTVTFRVIQKAEAEGWITELVSAACAERPGNEKLAAVAKPLSLVPDTPPRLEQMVSRRAGFHDIVGWRAELWRTEARVCQVEVPITPLSVYAGTGFLVGPDLVMTNYHVVEHLIAGADKQAARLRFDYKRAQNGAVIDEGVTFRLAEQWLVSASPPAESDKLGHGALPTSEQLDYALVRLELEVAGMTFGPVANEADHPRRGWVTISADTSEPAVDDAAMIVQHPRERPLEIAIDSVLDFNENRTRVRYKTNTDHGSSGAPCFNLDWGLAALHQGSGPHALGLSNQGIPIGAIVEDLSAKGAWEDLTPYDNELLS